MQLQDYFRGFLTSVDFSKKKKNHIIVKTNEIP